VGQILKSERVLNPVYVLFSNLNVEEGDYEKNKSVFSYLVVFCILIIFSFTGSFSFAVQNSYASADEIKVFLNGVEIKFDVAPYIKTRTMVPFRAIFEALGVDIS